MGKSRITDDEYAEMAADYETNPPTAAEVTSVELNPAYLPTGRPNKGTRTTGKTPVLTIRLPESLRNELVHSAEVQGATPSEMVRRAVVDSVSFYVLWEQTFDGDEWQWVRFDKALTPAQAEEMFKHFSRLALTHGYRRVQIRHGRDEVVKEWTASAHGRH
jgi:predicted transcriptional regulator